MNRSNLNRLIRVFLLASPLLVSASAAAQDGASGGTADGWAPVKRLEFNDDDIEASRLDPGGDLLVVTKRAEHSSLIELRRGFEVEIIKTMEDL